MPPLSDISGYALMFGLPQATIVGFIIFGVCVFNIDKLLLIQSKFWGLISGLSSTARKRNISSDIRGRILKATKSYKSISSEILPNDLKIVWIKDEDKDTFFQKNQIIIRMSKKNNPHENFVNAVTEFVAAGLLRKERIYIDSKVMKAADLSLVKKIVYDASEDSLTYYHNNILNPSIEDDEEIRDLIQDIAIIDGNGMFTNILLNEFMKAGRKLYPETIDPCLTAESKEFLRYLHRIAIKATSEPSDLNFNREYFKTAIFLAMNSETYAKSGIKPFLKYIFKCIDSGIETIYIFGLGQKINLANLIAEAAQESDLRIIETRRHYYKHRNITDGKRISGVCNEIVVYSGAVSD